MRLSIIFCTMTVQTQPGLRERNRLEVQGRIADAAARLATERGVAGTTADDIAAEAGVGRATFFRYFESKELAIAHGLSGAGAYVLAGVIADMPAALGPLAAVRAAQAFLGEHFAEQRAMFLEQAELSRSSAAMYAWTLHLYGEWETAIAEAVAPRFTDLTEDDPRPRMIGAMAMAAARLACDTWVAAGGTGDLPALIQQHLAALDLRA